MVQFLDTQASSSSSSRGWTRLAALLPDAPDESSIQRYYGKRENLEQLACIYKPTTTTTSSTEHDHRMKHRRVAAVDHSPSSSSSNEEDEDDYYYYYYEEDDNDNDKESHPHHHPHHHPRKNNFKTQCAHAKYSQLLFHLNHINDQETNYHNSNSNNNNVHMFTMVREPYHRLKSLFYYMYQHRALQWGQASLTVEQRQALLDKNFPQWLYLLYVQQHTPPLQYQYLVSTTTTRSLNMRNGGAANPNDHADVDEAIRLVLQGKVTVYVNECFETSLELLAHRFGIDIVDKKQKRAKDDKRTLLSSEESSANKDESSSSTTSTASASVLDNMKHHRQGNYNKADEKYPYNDDELQHQAKLWFPKEYKFYNVAVQVFQSQLVSETTEHGTSLIQHKCTLP